MNQALTEIQDLRMFAEERLAAHIAEINAAGGTDNKEHRKKIFNEHLIRYIEELNERCRDVHGVDCDGVNKSYYAVINEYQDRFMARY
jgi:hypothetical protein